MGSWLRQGKLIAAGPYVGTHDALIVVRAESAEAALELLENDPFNQAGSSLSVPRVSGTR